MIKMIIVEDEPLMSEYLAGCIKWNKCNIELCGIFFNGQSAYEYLSDNKVDLIVTDLKMPIMNGLELIEKSRRIYPDVKFIVLSCHNDFHMVKEAFILGATDYILKTEFDVNAFQKLLIKNFSTVPSKVLSPSQRSDAEHKRLLKQHFWNSDKHDLSAFYSDSFTMGVSASVAILKILNYNTIIHSSWNMDKELLEFGLSNIIQEVLDEIGNADFFFDDYNEIIFLFFSENNEVLRQNTQLVFTRIFKVLSLHFNLNSSVVVYDKPDSDTAKNQYSKATEALSYSFLLGENQTIYLSHLTSYTDLFNMKEYEQRLEQASQNLNFDTLLSLATELAATKPEQGSLSNLKKAYYDFVVSLHKIANSYDITISEELMSQNIESETAVSLNEKLTKMIYQISEKLSSSSIEMNKIRNYIDKNFSKNITLRQLATYFGFEYSVLSRAFRKHCGKGFSAYLTDVRLSEAIKLIRTTDFKINDISRMIGYNNYEHFSRVFKKKFGEWPNEIRKVAKQ